MVLVGPIGPKQALVYPIGCQSQPFINLVFFLKKKQELKGVFLRVCLDLR